MLDICANFKGLVNPKLQLLVQARRNRASGSLQLAPGQSAASLAPRRACLFTAFLPRPLPAKGLNAEKHPRLALPSSTKRAGNPAGLVPSWPKLQGQVGLNAGCKRGLELRSRSRSPSQPSRGSTRR